MPVNPTYPGVYVQEVASGVRTIAGVSTSVALILGRATQGPLNKPIQCLSYSDYERNFSSDSTLGEMTHQTKLFFDNGGSQCYVMRLANGALASSVTLQTTGATNTLTLSAKQAGKLGDTIRIEVDYRGPNAEATFNLSVYLLQTNPAGVSQQVAVENWQNLSMNPASPLFAPDYITQNSSLISAALHADSPAAANGFSQAGTMITYETGTPTTFRNAWAAVVGTSSAGSNQIQLSIDGSTFVNVDFAAVDVDGLPGASLANFRDQLAAALRSAIEDAFTANNLPGTSLDVEMITGPALGPNQAPNNQGALLRLTSQNSGDILVRPGGNNDLSSVLGLGAAQGGLEVTAHSTARPAPTGITSDLSDPARWTAFAELDQNEITQITLPAINADGSATTANVLVDLVTSQPDDPMFVGGVGEKLALMRDAINAFQASNRRTFFWTASVAGSRLSLHNSQMSDLDIPTISMAPTNFPTATAESFVTNVSRYRSGTTGTAGLQTPGNAGDDGSAPTLADYEAAYLVADKEVDLFNLMLLPRDAEPAQPMSDLYGPASVFCQKQRAFLIMEPPSDWVDSQSASSKVDDLRLGLVNDHAAVFYPNVTVNDNGRYKHVGPAGAIAGLMARIDSSRGIWKAPAGTEASLRGVVGLQYQFSDGENGVLNPRAVNTLRIFPNGIVNWGARTMDGDNDFGSEYKYIPIRRLALYMEESLYRGLKWVVFEPNDEPLWSQIRLNVGAFMHGLFRQGAFQGSTPKDAYFVKCDAETTTQADRNLGIVNIVVGFAPLKPAEFVVLSLQQIAGQLEAA
ncbi:MAG: phage tail sheath subtilisin-like domain-containing protein [Pseudomonadota bacterium]